jgi:spoIIIJ-associated protein
VQWVVTTGHTVDEARERALDALGVDDADLEVEVLAEPRTRLFGLRRTEARIRARVKPTRPRPKVDRRNRRKPPAGGGRRRRGRGSERVDRDDDVATPSDDNGDPAVDDLARDRTASAGRRRRPDEAAAPAPAPVREPDTPFDSPEPEPAAEGPTGEHMSDITLDEQQPSAVDFVEGLVEAFAVEAEVDATMIDDEHLEIAISGADLGLLVGPRGRTLEAIQELTRTAVAQQHNGRLEGRLRVDVAGYRARRKEALERFALQQADRVKETGLKVALEPMSPPDRKIVHDALNDVEGVRTASEGEDRRRHVVILPD